MVALLWAVASPLLQTPVPAGATVALTATQPPPRSPVSARQVLTALRPAREQSAGYGAIQAAYLAARHRRMMAARRAAAAALATAAAQQRTVTTAPVVIRSGVLTAAQVGAYWLAAGGPASQEGIAECVAYAESQDNPAQMNYKDNGGTQTSVGLFQLSTGTHAYPASWTTAAGNAAGAVAKYKASGWSPWPTAWGCGA